MTMQDTSNTRPAPERLRGIRRALAMATLLLAACGGVPEEPLVEAPALPASEVTPPPPPATLLAGLYKGNLDSNPSREFLALVVPEAGKNVHLYGWYYNANDPHLAHLYKGQLELGIEGNAANVAQSWRVIEGANWYPANASVSASSLKQLSAKLSISRSSVADYTLTAAALPQADYDPSATPMNLSNSSWNGHWSSGNNKAEGRLQFGANGATDVSGTNWQCFSGNAPLTWKWTAQSLNYFKVTLSLGSITLCPEWQRQSLEGVATVSKQNDVYQLDMMLLDGKGAGISYRGTR
jgi:hypothetical protein